MQKQSGNVLTACCKVGLITPVTTRTHTRRCGSPVNPGSYLLQAIYMAPVPDNSLTGMETVRSPVVPEAIPMRVGGGGWICTN